MTDAIRIHQIYVDEEPEMGKQQNVKRTSSRMNKNMNTSTFHFFNNIDFSTPSTLNTIFFFFELHTSSQAYKQCIT